MSTRKRIDTGGGAPLDQNPFGSLSGANLPREEGKVEGPQPPERSSRAARRPRKNRGRVEIRREKSGRGGKTVTTASGFKTVCPAELEEWTSELRKRCGAGGTSRSNQIEIQGDRREDLRGFFQEKGFRPVLAGG